MSAAIADVFHTPHILLRIRNQLRFRDFMHFRAVCRFVARECPPRKRWSLLPRISRALSAVCPRDAREFHMDLLSDILARHVSILRLVEDIVRALEHGARKFIVDALDVLYAVSPEFSFVLKLYIMVEFGFLVVINAYDKFQLVSMTESVSERKCPHFSQGYLCIDALTCVSMGILPDTKTLRFSQHKTVPRFCQECCHFLSRVIHNSRLYSECIAIDYATREVHIRPPGKRKYTDSSAAPFGKLRRICT